MGKLLFWLCAGTTLVASARPLARLMTMVRRDGSVSITRMRNSFVLVLHRQGELGG
jgi:hypothetical protein